jgi:site-specific DNA-methyltransferase (adenine-specific)
MGQHDLIRGSATAGDDWYTPDYIYRWASDRWGPFDLDPAASASNHKCARYYTKADNGLVQTWEAKRIWCNPPYGTGIDDWIRKGIDAALGLYSDRRPADAAVYLLPSRTSAGWWHELVLGAASEVCYIRGRVVFGGADHGAGFGSVFVVFEAETKAGPPIHYGVDIKEIRELDQGRLF